MRYLTAMRRFAAVGALTLGALLATTGVDAQEKGAEQEEAPIRVSEIGAREYSVFCAACHGPTARGDGPIAQLMTVPVADLTQISKENGGEFPLMRIAQIIDGRTQIRGHGSAMPVWGDRFMVDADSKYGPFDAEAIVRGRIFELALFLESIQEE